MSREGKFSELARGFAPQAGELAAEAERERRLPESFSRELADAGLYRLCVPASLDGGEAEPAELFRVVEALAEGDAAAGWCVAVCATSGMLGAYLEPDAAATVYGDPAGVVGGVFAPSGRAVADGDTLVVSGRWRFCSNAENCDWLMGGCIVFDGEAPRTLDSGRPDIRLVLMPADEVEVIDTWTVSGLRATGSHDIAVEGLEVPAARAASLLTDPPREAGPLYAFPPFGLLAAAIAAVALGDRPRSPRRARRARRHEDPDAQHAQARRAGGNPVGHRARRGRGTRGAGTALRGDGRVLEGGPGGRRDLGGAARLAASCLNARGRSRRLGNRRGLPPRRRQRDLRDEPSPAPLPRHPRGHPAHARRPGDLGAHRPLAAWPWTSTRSQL